MTRLRLDCPDDYHWYLFGRLAIVLDENGKLACLALCIETPGGQTTLVKYTGRLYGASDRVRRRSRIPVGSTRGRRRLKDLGQRIASGEL